MSRVQQSHGRTIPLLSFCLVRYHGLRRVDAVFLSTKSRSHSIRLSRVSMENHVYYRWKCRYETYLGSKSGAQGKEKKNTQGIVYFLLNSSPEITNSLSMCPHRFVSRRRFTLPRVGRSSWQFRGRAINVRAARRGSLLSDARVVVGCARPRAVAPSVDSSLPCSCVSPARHREFSTDHSVQLWARAFPAAGGTHREFVSPPVIARYRSLSRPCGIGNISAR